MTATATAIRVSSNWLRDADNPRPWLRFEVVIVESPRRSFLLGDRMSFQTMPEAETVRARVQLMLDAGTSMMEIARRAARGAFADKGNQ